MTRTLPGKLGIKPGMKALIVAPPPGYVKLLAPLPEGVTISPLPEGKYAFVQTFAQRPSDVHKFAQTLSRHAAPDALVWLSYPKKTSRQSDLSRDQIRQAMSCRGWRAVSIIAIDEVWSALRFRPAARSASG